MAYQDLRRELDEVKDRNDNKTGATSVNGERITIFKLRPHLAK